MTGSDKIAVLAGTYREFRDFLSDRILIDGMKDAKDRFVYATDVQRVEGMEFKSYIIIGTFYWRNDCSDILDHIRAYTRP